MVFQAGDHICLPRGHTGTIKHHAIVVTTENKDGDMEILEYGVFDQNGKKKLYAGHGIDFISKEHGEIRKHKVNTNKEKWRLVNYNKRDKSVKPAADVVQAALFLLEKGSTFLPAYHVSFANGECVSSWCKTGRFASGQAETLYDSVNNVEKVSKVLPLVGMGAKKSAVTTAAKGSTAKGSAGATMAGAAALATVVAAASTMIHNHKEKVAEEWAKTNAMLDEAFLGASQ